jgi:hypothetical protein
LKLAGGNSDDRIQIIPCNSVKIRGEKSSGGLLLGRRPGGLKAWKLGGWEAGRLEKGVRLKGKMRF